MNCFLFLYRETHTIRESYTHIPTHTHGKRERAGYVEIKIINI